MNTLRREIGALGWILRTVTFGLVAAADLQGAAAAGREADVARPAVDAVPYEFRIPIPRKLDPAFGTPFGDIFSEQPFGVGWTIDFGALLPTLQGLIAPRRSSRGTQRRASRAKAA